MLEPSLTNCTDCSNDWIAIGAFLISLAALAVAIVTTYLRDTHRGFVRLWFPNPNGALPEDARDPYLEVINLSPFDVRIQSVYAETSSGNKFHFPGPFGDDIVFPLEVGARRSIKIDLHLSCFYGLPHKTFKVFAETDTGKLFSAKRKSNKAAMKYVNTVVAEQEGLADEVRRQTASEFRGDRNE